MEGTIEAYPMEEEARPPFVGFYTLIRLVGTSRQLRLQSRLLSNQPDTGLSIASSGTVEYPEDITEQSIDPAAVVDMASAGVDLMTAYTHLPSGEQRDLSLIPYGNQKVFDEWHFHRLPERQLLLIAQAVLLEPDAPRTSQL